MAKRINNVAEYRRETAAQMRARELANHAELEIKCGADPVETIRRLRVSVMKVYREARQ